MRPRALAWLAWLAALALCATARAENDAVLRVASVAPAGSAWANELIAFGRAVERATDGHVRFKWYFNGVAGDELEQGDRIMRGQLDGSASGQMLCEKIAPTMRITRLPGLFQSRAETSAIMNRLQPTIEAEAHGRAIVLPATTGIGPDVIFSRAPIRSMDDLRRIRIWRWDIDEVGIATSRAMGLQIVPLPIGDAGRAYDERRIDAFFSNPAAALAFQWSTRTPYVTDLRGSYIWGCFLFAERTFSRLPVAYQTAIREAAAVTVTRFEDLGQRTDAAILGGLLRRQGVTPVPVTESFRAEFFAAARHRPRAGGQALRARRAAQPRQQPARRLSRGAGVLAALSRRAVALTAHPL